MKSQRFVCPDDEALLARLSGRAVAVRVGDAALIGAAAAKAGESGNDLFCVVVEADRPLSDIDLGDEPITLPVALMAPSLGRFRVLARRIDVLRRSTVRVYLPCNDAANVASLRILASLGVHACADFSSGPYDWEALADLMVYAILGRAPRAAIEPFATIASGWDPHAAVPWGAIEFDDPTRFLHLDAQGRIALSRDELRRGIFVAQSPDEIDSPALVAAVDRRANRWRDYFVDNHPCASCAGWRACLGRFAADLAEDAGCAGFFAELIDAVTALRASAPKPEQVDLWRP